MLKKRLLPWGLALALLAGLAFNALPAGAQTAQVNSVRASQVTAYELILAMNSLRVGNGLPALIEDPIVNAVAQATARIMADNLLTWHIGDVRGRLAAAGYGGGGGTVWGTENFAVGYTLTLDEIMVIWADEAHMLPAVKPYYCHVGAGVAEAANGMVYYVLQAAYVSGQTCPSSPSSPGVTPGTTPVTGGGVPGIIFPVKVATPDADGNVYHVVELGQSLWSIAIAYKVTIADIETWNNISRETPLRTGQKLLIPGENTKGYATPTPQGMILQSTPDADGRIIHIVEAYQTLSTISAAYHVSLDTILTLNRIQADWPLQIGQKLTIHPGNITPSPTPRPLTPIEKLTPASDGNYYHIVKSGETLSWIADLYVVPLNDLMAWNGLTLSSILNVDQKLLLKVTPPVIPSDTPLPPTATATLTPAPPTATATLRHTATRPLPSITPTPAPAAGPSSPIYLLGGVVATIGVLLWFSLARGRSRAAEFFEEPGETEDEGEDDTPDQAED